MMCCTICTLFDTTKNRTFCNHYVLRNALIINYKSHYKKNILQENKSIANISIKLMSRIKL